jgi:hypothetical protein
VRLAKPIRPTRLGRISIFILLAGFGLSFVSGLGLWYIHELREKLGDLPKWTAFCQSLHGLLNPVLCVYFGFMLPHVAGGWRMNANRKTGGALALSFVLLIITGAALYYSDHRHFYFTVHLVAGLLFPFILVAHWRQARRWAARLPSEKTQIRANESQGTGSR